MREKFVQPTRDHYGVKPGDPHRVPYREVQAPLDDHCQAGNYGLAFQVITAWLDSQAGRAQQG